jgi:glycosyltransferase involved in cell wall biosynthesis
MVGGPQPGFNHLYQAIQHDAATLPNVTFHGQVPYQGMDEKYGRARIFVNTSDSEGFPNSYLQAWIRGTPVVAFFDPDHVIKTQNLGVAASSIDDMVEAVVRLISAPTLWASISARCRSYMAHRYAEERILSPYNALLEKIS